MPRRFHTAALIPERVRELGRTLLEWPIVNSTRLVGDSDGFSHLCELQGKRIRNCVPPDDFP